MPAKIIFEVEGEEQFNRTFSRLDATFKDLSPVWDEVRDAFWEIEEDQFQSSGAKGRTGKWKDLSPAYEKQKIARYGTFAVIAGVMFATERLYKSLTRETGDMVYKKTKTEMAIGTSVPYAKYHQQGGGNLPKRELIALSEQNKKDLQKRIQKSLLKTIKQRGIYVQTDIDDI